jgi:glucokinase
LETIEREAEQFINKGKDASITQNNAYSVCNAALQNDPIARQIIDSIVKNVTLGIINVIVLLNPELIVIGGDILELPQPEKLFLHPIEKSIRETIPLMIPKFCLSQLGKDAGVIGAFSLAVESLLGKKYPYEMSNLSENA